MKKRLLILLAFLFAFQAAQAQIKIDVKTKIKNKKELIYIKAGVKAYINKSPNFKAVEFGEDFQLWILDHVNQNSPSRVYTTVKYELKRPVLFGKNELVRSGFINIDYSKNPVNTAVNYSVLAKRMEKDIKKYLFMADLSYHSTKSGSIGNGIRIAFKNLSVASRRETGLEPTKSQLVQNTLVGIKTVEVLNDLFGY